MAKERVFKPVGTEEAKPKVEENASTDPLENIFANFQKSKSEHKTEDFVDETKVDKAKKEASGEKVSKSSSSAQSEEEKKKQQFTFELQKKIFVKVANLLVSGLHMIIFNFIKPETKVTMAEMKLTAQELADLDEYITEEIVKVITFMPPWMWGLIEIESMYIGKWNAITTRKEKENAEKKKAEREAKKDEVLTVKKPKPKK